MRIAMLGVRSAFGSDATQRHAGSISFRHLASRALLVLLAVLHLTCNQAILSAPDGATLFIEANPRNIPAFGGVSVISVRVFERIGTPVADGTVVQFFTNLGRIDEQAKTNDGVARVNLVSDTRSGTATVTAFSGAADSQTVEVAVGGGIPPSRLLLSANPERLTDRRASNITALVFDAAGNPVPNIGVVFRITSVRFVVTPAPSPSPAPPVPSPVIDDFMESRGSPVFTDTSGRAVDVMRTNRPFGGPQVVVSVEAETFNGVKAAAPVTVIVD
jgi:hypothetical protein